MSVRIREVNGGQGEEHRNFESIQYNTTESEDPVRSVLISFSYQGERRIPMQVMMNRLEIMTQQMDATPISGVGYDVPYALDPREVSLTDVWMKMSHEDRQYIYDKMPDLYRAIFLILKGLEDLPEGEDR